MSYGIGKVQGSIPCLIRLAEPSEAGALTEIAWVSKRHWGYPDDSMARWRAALEITPAYIGRIPVFAAEHRGALAALCAVVKLDARWDLDHLWVRPEHIGHGIGRLLFGHAVSHVRAKAAGITLGIESDPKAEGFYVRMGARRVGTIVRDWKGLRRELPYLEYRVPAN